MKYSAIIFSLSLLILSSCASVSTLQTAETTPEGTFDHIIGLGQVSADVSEVSGVQVESDDACYLSEHQKKKEAVKSMELVMDLSQESICTCSESKRFIRDSICKELEKLSLTSS